MTAPCINSSENCSVYLHFCPFCVPLKQSHTQCCPTSICGDVALVFVRTKYRARCRYLLVLLTKANLA